MSIPGRPHAHTKYLELHCYHLGEHACATPAVHCPMLTQESIVQPSSPLSNPAVYCPTQQSIVQPQQSIVQPQQSIVQPQQSIVQPLQFIVQC